MAKISDKPDGLPTGNTIDATLLTDEIDTSYVSFQCDNVKIENPPELGESVTFMVHGKVVETKLKENKDGEIRPHRTIRIHDAHAPGKRPTKDPNQSPLFAVVSDATGTRTEGEVFSDAD